MADGCMMLSVDRVVLLKQFLFLNYQLVIFFTKFISCYCRIVTEGVVLFIPLSMYYNTTRDRRCCSQQWLVLLPVRCHLQDIINIGFTLYIKLYWFGGHPDPAAVSKILKLHCCCFFDFYQVCCELKPDAGRNLYDLFHWN